MSEPEGEPARARRLGEVARVPLPKRFYARSAAMPGEGGFVLTLDGRPARTPARRPLVMPARSLADAVAAEWDAQVDTIDPATMPLTRIVNSAIDGVADEIETVRADLARYAASDLVCYRAGEPDSLVVVQAAHWDPVLAWARAALGAQFVMSLGVMYVQQPEPALARVRAALDREDSAFALAALHVMTTLSGSVLIALAHTAGALDGDAAWRAAHVDELHQERLWGEDHEAGLRRAARRTEFMAASLVYGLARAG